MNAEPMDATTTERDVMTILYRANERIPAAEVSRRLNEYQDGTTQSRQQALRGLYKRGWVDIMRLDERSHGYALTERGEEKYNADLRWRSFKSL